MTGAVPAATAPPGTRRGVIVAASGPSARSAGRAAPGPAAAGRPASADRRRRRSARTGPAVVAGRAPPLPVVAAVDLVAVGVGDDDLAGHARGGCPAAGPASRRPPPTCRTTCSCPAGARPSAAARAARPGSRPGGAAGTRRCRSRRRRRSAGRAPPARSPTGPTRPRAVQAPSPRPLHHPPMRFPRRTCSSSSYGPTRYAWSPPSKRVSRRGGYSSATALAAPADRHDADLGRKIRHGAPAQAAGRRNGKPSEQQRFVLDVEGRQDVQPESGPDEPGRRQRGGRPHVPEAEAGLHRVGQLRSKTRIAIGTRERRSPSRSSTARPVSMLARSLLVSTATARAAGRLAACSVAGESNHR